MAEEYVIYLRKSRADAEAEARGEGETLARHQSQLLDLSKRLHLNVTEIYKELVSGDTIAARPVMQKLLKEVNNRRWMGVMCMEVERLARGDSIDQGVVAQAFKYSSTKIITPTKTYNPDNEFDEEYFEFSLFMSRREYKTIKRRMQAGRQEAVKEGNYIGSMAPYGYKKIHNYEKRCHTLEIIPEEAETVKLIYHLFTQKDMGYSKIATYLNNMGIKPKRVDVWSYATVKVIIENPLYLGKLRWNWRKTERKIEGDKVVTINPINKNPDIYQGLHSPIIDNDTWELAQTIRNNKTHTPAPRNKVLKNQFVGLMYCGFCSHAMIRKPFKSGLIQMICIHNGCKCVAGKIEDIDNAVYKSILKTYHKYLKVQNDNPQDNSCSLDFIETKQKFEKELEKIKTQQSKLHDFLEQGIYSPEVFLERSKVLSNRIEEINKNITELNNDLKPAMEIKEILLRLKNVVSLYQSGMSAEEKNQLLKTVIKRITYTKTTSSRWKESDMQVSVDFLF